MQRVFYLILGHVVCMCVCFSTEPGVSSQGDPILFTPSKVLGSRPTVPLPPLGMLEPSPRTGSSMGNEAGIWVGICVCVEGSP